MPDSTISEKIRGDTAPCFWLSEDEVRVEIEGHLPPCPVVLLSATAAWIDPDCLTHYPLDATVRAVIRGGDAEIGPVPATLTLRSVGMRGPLLGVLLHDPSSRSGEAIAELARQLVAAGHGRLAAPALLHGASELRAAARETIDEPRRIRNVMSVLVKRKAIVRDADRGPPLCVQLDSVDVLNDRVTWRGIAGWSDLATIELVGYSSVFRFHGRGAPAREGELWSALPVSIERIRQRPHLPSATAPEAELTASYVHPLWPTLPPVRGEVVDVSFNGMRMAARADEHLLYPGLQIPLEMLDGDHEVIHLLGEVRSVAPSSEDPAVHVCALRVAASARADERRWLRLVSRVLHATPDGGPAWREELWNLFEASGYFGLSGKTSAYFDAVKPRFLRMAKKAAEVPHLMYNAACLSERGIEGNFSLVKAYDGTWMLHQLAKRPRSALNVSSRQVLRDIYSSSFEHAQADPELRWIIGYVEAGIAWNERAHFEFTRRHEHTGLVLAQPFELFEVDASAARLDDGDAPSRDLQIGAAEPAEIGALLSLLRETRPAAFVEALALVPDRFAQRDFHERWRRAGLERERAALVARREGQAIAAAIVELGEVGTNLFRLLDSVRLIPMRPGGEGALAPLLDAARAWFLARSRASFVYFRDGANQLSSARGVSGLGEGKLWIISSRLVPEFLDNFYQLTAPKRPGG